MNKVLKYELRRVLTSGLFIVLILVNCMFAWYILSTEIVSGIAYTAPFSVWSYCGYIAKTLPIAMITILLVQSSFYSKKQKKTEVLITATPVTYGQLIALRTSVTAVCYLVICIINTVMAVVFYVRFFHFYNFLQFILPSLLIIVPCFIFVTACGQIAGRVHISLIYLVMIIIFAAGFTGGSSAFSLFGSGFFSEYPMTLPLNNDGEPGFKYNTIWVIARLIYLCIGTVTVLLSVKLKPKSIRA